MTEEEQAQELEAQMLEKQMQMRAAQLQPPPSSSDLLTGNGATKSNAYERAVGVNNLNTSPEQSAKAAATLAFVPNLAGQSIYGAGKGAAWLKNALLGGAISSSAEPNATVGQKAMRFGAGAFMGGAASLAPQALGQGARVVGSAVGSGLSHMPFKEAYKYTENPAMAENTYSQMESGSGDLHRSLKRRLKDALFGEGNIFQREVEPLLKKRGEMEAGKSAVVQPEDLAGTDSLSELERMHGAKNPAKEVAEVNYGEPDIQTPLADTSGSNPYHYRVEVPVYAPQTKVSYPATPMPDKVSLEAAQLRRLIDKLNEEAQIKADKLGYVAKDEPAAIARNKLKKASNAVVPGIEDVNAQIGEHAAMQDAIKGAYAKNPARLLYNAETPGNVANKAMREYLDKYGNTGFEDMAEFLQAGKSMNNLPTFSKDPNLLKKLGNFAGKGIIKAAGHTAQFLQSPRFLEGGVPAYGSSMLVHQNPWTLLPTAEDDKK